MIQLLGLGGFKYKNYISTVLIQPLHKKRKDDGLKLFGMTSKDEKKWPDLPKYTF
jgi:hypothetical protein